MLHKSSFKGFLGQEGVGIWRSNVKYSDSRWVEINIWMSQVIR